MTDGLDDSSASPTDGETLEEVAPQLSDRWKAFLRGSAISMVATVFIGVCNYLIRRMLSMHLPDADYGFFYGAMAVVLLVLGLLDMGTSKSLIIMMAKAAAENNRVEIQKIFSAGLLIRTTGAVIAMALLIGFSQPLLTHHFEFQTHPWVLPSIFLLILLHSFGGTFSTFFSSVKAFFLQNLLQLVRTTAIIVAAVFLVPRYGLQAAAILFPAASLVGVCVGVACAYGRYRIWFSLRLALDRTLVAKIFHFSKWIAFPIMGMTAMFQLDTICLTWLDSLEEVARYNIALPIMQILQSLMIFPLVLTPIITEMWQRGSRKEIAAVCRTMVYVLIALVGPVVGGGILFGERIITILFDARFADVKWPMVALWTGMIFLTIAGCLLNALGSGNHHKKLVVPVLLALVVNISLNVCLIPRYGAMGAAVATAGSYAVLATLLVILMTVYVGRVLDPMIPVNVLLGIGYLYGAYVVHGLPWNFPVKASAYGLSAVILLTIVLLISRSTRQEFKNLMSKLLKR